MAGAVFSFLATLVTMWRRVAADNPWVLPVLGVVGVAATFAIGGVVPGIIGAFVFLLVLVGALLNSLRRAHSSLESSVTEESPDAVPAAHEATAQDLAQESMSTDLESMEPDEADDEDRPSDPFMAAIQAMAKGDLSAAEAEFEGWTSAGENDDDKLLRRAISLRWLAVRGKTTALSKLLELKSQNLDSPHPLAQLASAHGGLADPRTAAEVVENGLSDINEADHFDLLIAQAGYWKDADEAELSLRAADTSLRLANNPAQLASAQAARGRALEKGGRKLEAFGAYEEALTSDPTDATLRFDLAYGYSEAGLAPLAVFNYQLLVEQDPGSHGTRNNLAVALRGLDIQSEAVIEQKRAAEHGERYAPANLARALIKVGFLDEAIEWIRKAQAIDNPPQIVGGTAAAIAEMKDKDKKRRREVISEGDSLRPIFRSFASQADQSDPSGTWLLDDGRELSFRQSSSSPDTFVAQVGEGWKKLRVEFTRQGQGFRVAWTTGESSPSTYEGYGVVDGQGFQGVLLDKPSIRKFEIIRASRDTT